MEYALREGNSAFVEEGQTLRLSRDQKHNILDVMAAEIYKHKAYPSTKQIGEAAEALVSKHPCLKENGSKTGYEGWKNSLRFKMGNYRTKLSRAGIKDVAVNVGKRSRTNPEGAASRTNIKRARRGEVNFLPNYPHGETKDTLEIQRLEMVEQFKKTSIERDMILIHHHMQRTFPLRREGIVNSAPPIAELKDRWPALFCEAQVSKNLKRTLQMLTRRILSVIIEALLDLEKSSSCLICYVCLSENVVCFCFPCSSTLNSIGSPIRIYHLPSLLHLTNMHLSC